MTAVKIEASWKEVLSEEFDKAYFTNLVEFLKQEKAAGQLIYPPGNQIFAAFDATPFEAVKVVILGQDPYHGPGQAHGLCFSVNNGIAHPPSLQNIFKELSTEVPGFRIPQSGNLSKWANQGVLLLNATLTVRAGQAGSHQKKGWETFTDAVISALSEQKENLVFILWGAYAKSKASLIDTSKHAIVSSVHPSPLSAYNGFFGSRPFSKTNEELQRRGIAPIDWNLKID
ncbi:uracil-DNA glycosylase [Bacteroidota bacterium]